ncbi:MAG: MerR family DNA-binding transcriptional regulator [Dermatophilaceae bacterium]
MNASTPDALGGRPAHRRVERVDPATATRSAVAGKISSCRTLGGHRRYRATEFDALLDEEGGLTREQ